MGAQRDQAEGATRSVFDVDRVAGGKSARQADIADDQGAVGGDQGQIVETGLIALQFGSHAVGQFVRRHLQQALRGGVQDAVAARRQVTGGGGIDNAQHRDQSDDEHRPEHDREAERADPDDVAPAQRLVSPRKDIPLPSP
ncbi:hypothetical protein [Sphingomonas sp.]|uniref:hypothetical protein n=1 Tax=Sphingomonas sp. TaxID=28214 RepID=UPI0035C82CCC